MHLGTEKDLSAEVKKAKESVEKAKWLNSDIKDDLVDKLDVLEGFAENVNACIHHEVLPEIPGDLTIEMQTNGPKIEGVTIEYKLQF